MRYSNNHQIISKLWFISSIEVRVKKIPMKFEGVSRISVGGLGVKIWREIDNVDSFKGAFLYAYSAPDAQDFREERNFVFWGNLQRAHSLEIWKQMRTILNKSEDILNINGLRMIKQCVCACVHVCLSWFTIFRKKVNFTRTIFHFYLNTLLPHSHNRAGPFTLMIASLWFAAVVIHHSNTGQLIITPIRLLITLSHWY